MEKNKTEKGKLRKIENRDVFHVVDLLKKLSSDSLPKIMKGVVDVNVDAKASKKNKSNSPLQQHYKIGMLIFTELYTELRDELITWLADMVNMNAEEFMVADGTVSIDIVEKLITDKEYNGFFLRVYNLYKMMPE